MKCSFVAADVYDVRVAVDAESLGCCVSCFDLLRWNNGGQRGGGGGGGGDIVREQVGRCAKQLNQI